MQDLFDLSGKVALITGGSRGLGYCIAKTFAASGADVIISSRKLAACETVARKFRRLGAARMRTRATWVIGTRRRHWCRRLTPHRQGRYLTDIATDWPKDKESNIKAAIPRFGEPDEIATTALYLASSRSSFTTGALIRVDGGRSE